MLINRGDVLKKIFLLVDGLYARSIVGITNYFILSILYLGLATIGEMIFSPVSKKVAANSFGHGNDGIGFAAWKTNYYLSDVIGGLFVEYLR